jgi:hypothetical protein
MMIGHEIGKGVEVMMIGHDIGKGAHALDDYTILNYSLSLIII